MLENLSSIRFLYYVNLSAYIYVCIQIYLVYICLRVSNLYVYFICGTQQKTISTLGNIQVSILLLLYGTFYKRCTRGGSRGLLSYSRDSNNTHTNLISFAIFFLHILYLYSIYFIHVCLLYSQHRMLLYSAAHIIFSQRRNCFLWRTANIGREAEREREFFYVKGIFM